MFPVESFQETLGKAVALFEKHTIRFHLTGGITSIAYGEPRMTQDVDIVIENRAATACLESFLASLADSDFLHDPIDIRRAVAQEDMFQLLDKVESLKLDVYPREMIPGELDRSELVEVFEGMRLPIASRADTGAAKLLWVSKGSHKSRRDLRHLYRASSPNEQAMIQALAAKWRLEALLAEVLDESDEIS